MESSITLPAGFCPDCDERALMSGHVADKVFECADCGCSVTSDAIEWIGLDAAHELGYKIDGYQPPTGERGCRGGSCGVQQPTKL